MNGRSPVKRNHRTYEWSLESLLYKEIYHMAAYEWSLPCKKYIIGHMNGHSPVRNISYRTYEWSPIYIEMCHTAYMMVFFLNKVENLTNLNVSSGGFAVGTLS